MSARLERSCVVLLCIALLGVSAAFGQTLAAYSHEELRPALETVFVSYVRGVESLDSDIWIANWDEGGVKFVPNAPAIVGRDAIYAFVSARFPLFDYRRMRVRIDAIDVSGDLALARGVYLSEDKLKTASGAAITDGWFLTTFKRQADGSWKIFRDAVGTNAPPK